MCVCVFVLCCLLCLYWWFALSIHKYLKENLDIRVKYPTCLLSLGLATGAASSACRFLPEDWAPLTAWLLMISFLAMINTHKHMNWHKLRNLRIKLFCTFSLKKKKKSLHSVIYFSRSYFVQVYTLFKFVAKTFYLCYLKYGVVQCGKRLFFLKWN